jgi:CxxC-x17-CxxC domain-containing protein
LAYTDRTLTCTECGQEFTFTASEQEFFVGKGYTNEPKRCQNCREQRRLRNGVANTSTGRTLYSAVCAQCGQPAQVPFQPRGDRPVYYSSCFSKTRATPSYR